jgi:hypothetical protein
MAIEMLSTVPVVVDRTMFLLMNAVIAGRSIISVTGLYVIGTIVTGVITADSSSDVTVVR